MTNKSERGSVSDAVEKIVVDETFRLQGAGKKELERSGFAIGDKVKFQEDGIEYTGAIEEVKIGIPEGVSVDVIYAVVILLDEAIIKPGGGFTLRKTIAIKDIIKK